MKKIILAASAAVALFAVPAVASAETSFYGNIGYTSAKSEDSGLEMTLGAITGRAGAKFNPYIAVEGEASIGVQDDDIAGVVDVELKHQVGVFVVGSYPVTDYFDVFARVGYASTEYEVSAGGASGSDTLEEGAYGVGAQLFFKGDNAVRFDYTRYAADTNAWSVSYVRRF